MSCADEPLDCKNGTHGNRKGETNGQMGHDDDQVAHWFCDQWKALGIGEGQADKALAEPQSAIELNSN